MAETEQDLKKAPDRTAMAQSERRDGTIKWLEAHWTNSRECPICSTAMWNIANVAEMPEFLPDTPPTGQIYPLVPIMCSNCGYTIFFNAVHMGLLPPPVASGEEASSDTEQS